LLAFQTDEFIETFIKHSGLRPFSRNSITDPNLLWQQIREIRRTGIAINQGEHFEDIAAIAAPVFGRNGQIIAGVSLAYPRYLYPDLDAYQAELTPLLREVAGEI